MILRVSLKNLRILLLAGVAAAALSACATNRPDTGVSADGPVTTRAQAALADASARYKKNPRDKATIIYFAGGLRAAGQAEQAVAVLESGISVFPTDLEIRIAYAKALTAAGRFQQAMNVIEDAIDPAAPDWNALLVKGAVLDQMGRNKDARAIYTQALIIAPTQAALEANIGLSYAMSNDLANAELHLRKAVAMPGASSQVRQNLALVIGLQGRFDEARALFAAELPPDQVEANMAYIKALLTQQDRWAQIKSG